MQKPHESYDLLVFCRLVVKRYALKQSVLEDVMDEPVTATDPLNGACQLGKTQPSPFSSRKVMYENEEVSCMLLIQNNYDFESHSVGNMFLET